VHVLKAGLITPPKRRANPEDKMAAKIKGTVAVVEKAEAVLKRCEYGIDQPTLVVGTRTTDTACALRHNRALGLRAAAEVELALADAGDKAWSVNDPVWGDEQRLPTGWRTTYLIKLESCQGANPKVAMGALTKVAEMLAKGALR
jgi:hypothetical protein